MNHQNKINDLTQKLKDAQQEIEAIKARINYWQDYRPHDMETAQVALSHVEYLESKKATLERIALSRAFNLAHLLGESMKASV